MDFPTSAATARGIRASPGNIAEMRWKGVKSADKQVDVPFLPAALELFNQRVTSNSKDDPEAQCLPVGVPRYMFDPYAFEMVQTPKQVMFLFEGDNYLWRTVPLRAALEHPKDAKPTWMGDAAGHYEKDTLVVDVMGFNGKAWLDQAGHPQIPAGASDRALHAHRFADAQIRSHHRRSGRVFEALDHQQHRVLASRISTDGVHLQENEKDSVHMTKERL